MQTVESIPPTGISLFLSNKDRVNYGESAFDFFLPQIDFTELNTQTYTVLVKLVLLKNYFHNIVLNKSDILEIKVNNIIYTNVFEPGYYTVSSLQESIQSFFTTINPSLTITYDFDEKKFIIYIPSTITFEFVVPNSNPNTYQPFQYNNRQMRFLEIIGFQNYNQYSKLYSTEGFIVAENPVNLYGSHFVDINFQNSSLRSINTTRGLKTLVRVPLTTTYGQLEVYEPSVPITSVLEAQTFENLRIIITDEWGDVVTGPKESLFSLSLLLVSNDF